MISTPEDELERVLQKYPPMRWQDLCVYLLSIAAMLAASLYREVGWYFFVGMLTGVAFWEFTKFRLRRNARDFVRANPWEPQPVRERSCRRQRALSTPELLLKARTAHPPTATLAP